MATRQLENVEELIKLARKRVSFSRNWQSVKYYRDVDLLAVRFSDNPATHSKDDIEKGLIYNYDAEGNLANIEILDLYDIFEAFNDE
jgi:hypothetical protein